LAAPSPDVPAPQLDVSDGFIRCGADCSTVDLVVATPLPKPGDTLTQDCALGGMRVRHAETGETGAIVEGPCTGPKWARTWTKRVRWDRSIERHRSDPFCDSLVLVGCPHGRRVLVGGCE
jgi:hypothetical protein